jgi:hypothetical protein
VHVIFSPGCVRSFPRRLILLCKCLEGELADEENQIRGFMRRVKITTLVIALLAAIPLWAGSIDVIVGSGGTINVDHKPHPIQGRMIDVTTLGIGSDILPVLMGTMTFETGAETSHQGDDYTFGAGGGLKVTGCVDLGNDKAKKCDKKDFSGVLLTAKFLNAEIVEQGGKFYLEAEVLEQINPRLAALLKLTKTTYLAKLDLELIQDGHNKWVFRESVSSGSLMTMPEPSSIALLGIPLLSLAGLYRFRARKPL